MPELPEVETIARELRDQVTGEIITQVTQLRSGTVTDLISPARLPCPLGTITSIGRRGKYLIFDLSTAILIVVHLGMTGKLITATAADERPDHLRALFSFAGGRCLFFDDIRTFGHITLQKQSDPLYFEPRLGIEPLSSAFNKNYLKQHLVNRPGPVKNLLLDQSLIAGIGNIYACEALYRSRIHPATSGAGLSVAQMNALVLAVKEVLTAAIEHNGTTISDYRRVDDKTGDFQNFLRVYQKTACPRGHAVQKIVQAGRTTYYCPACQKAPILPR